MSKINISAEELEMMNYNDVAYEVLKARGKKMKIMELFQEVVEILNLLDDDYMSHITDFFGLLSTDKRFIMLNDGYWDLRVKHDKGMVIDEDDEDDDDIVIEEEDANESEYENEEDKDTDDDVEEDDLSDLVVIDDSDEENNM